MHIIGKIGIPALTQAAGLVDGDECAANSNCNSVSWARAKNEEVEHDGGAAVAPLGATGEVTMAVLKDALKASTGCPGLRLASSWVEGPLMVF